MTTPLRLDRPWLTAALVLVMMLAPVAVALFHDIHRSFITTSDGDIVYIYEALRLNDGLAQHYHLHTGYTLFLLLSKWLKLMAALGAVPVAKLSQLPPLGSEEFQTGYAQWVVAGRWLSAGLSGLLALLFALTIRLLTGRRDVALAAGLVFAFSRALGAQALHIFTELPSMLGLLASLACLVAASRSPRPYGLLFAAGLAATLGLMSKMQGIFIAAALPVLALPLAHRGTLRPIPRPGSAVPLALLASAVILIGATMVAHSVAAWGKSGASQLAVVALIAGCVWAFGRLETSAGRDRLYALLAVGAGISAALLVHLVHHNMVVVEELANFYDNMALSANFHQTMATEPTLASVSARVANGLLSSLHRRFLAPAPLTEPLDLLNWVAVAMTATLAWRRQWRPFLQMALFCGLAVCVEAVFRLYQLHIKTAIYVDIWLLTAVAIGAAALLPTCPLPARRAALGATALIVALEVAALTSPTMVWRQGTENACGQAEGYMAEIKEGFARYCKPAEEPPR